MVVCVSLGKRRLACVGFVGVNDNRMRLLLQMLWRATWWRCPHCGERPIFVSIWRTRSLYDWFTPLDGCPRCGYAYEREPGYFLLAIWAINYTIIGLTGVLLYALIDGLTDWSLQKILAVVLPLSAVMAVLLIRHAKAWFIAFDQWCDPALPMRRNVSRRYLGRS